MRAPPSHPLRRFVWLQVAHHQLVWRLRGGGRLVLKGPEEAILVHFKRLHSALVPFNEKIGTQLQIMRIE